MISCIVFTVFKNIKQHKSPVSSKSLLYGALLHIDNDETSSESYSWHHGRCGKDSNNGTQNKRVTEQQMNKSKLRILVRYPLLSSVVNLSIVVWPCNYSNKCWLRCSFFFCHTVATSTELPFVYLLFIAQP